MEVVASHLFQEVLKRTDQDEKNLFARSAFNRCYYATFLNVRAGLKQLNPEWSKLPHKDIPEVLKVSVKKMLVKGKAKASKVNDVESMRLCERAVVAARDLSEIMKTGYATRVAADYFPEIKIVFAGGQNCSLNSVGSTEAQYWPRQSAAYVGTIVEAWNQING